MDTVLGEMFLLGAAVEAQPLQHVTGADETVRGPHHLHSAQCTVDSGYCTILLTVDSGQCSGQWILQCTVDSGQCTLHYTADSAQWLVDVALCC